MSKIQGDQIGFAQSLSQAVEESYQWKSSRGLEIVKTAILAIEYDDDTKELMKDVKKADALSGSRGNAFMQQAVARGMQAAGETGGGAGVAFMGMGMNAAGGVMQGMQQPPTVNAYNPSFGNPHMQGQYNPQMQGQYNPQMQGQYNPNMQGQYAQQPPQPQQVDPTTKLIEMKKLLDAGVVTQEEFDKLKADLLGL